MWIVLPEYCASVQASVLWLDVRGSLRVRVHLWSRPRGAEEVSSHLMGLGGGGAMVPLLAPDHTLTVSGGCSTERCCTRNRRKSLAENT